MGLASGPKAVRCLRRRAGDLRWGGYLQLLLGMRQWDRYKVRRGAKGAGSLGPALWKAINRCGAEEG